MLDAIRKADPFGAAYIDKFNKEQERKREFLEHMMRTLPPGMWSVLGTMITNMVLKAAPGDLDRAFAEVEKLVASYMKASALGGETSPVLTALDLVEKFLGDAAPKAKET